MARVKAVATYEQSLASQIGNLRGLSEEIAERMAAVLMGFESASQVIDAVLEGNPNAKAVAQIAKGMIDTAKAAIGN